MLKLLAMVTVLTLAACGDDPPNVAGTCAMTEDCDEGLTCDVTIPGGYCTTSCSTSGTTDGCPDGSVCDTVSGSALTCVRICKDATDCRADLDCNGVSGSSVKACKPKD